MHLTFSIQLCLDGRPLDARLVDLLEALHTYGSVAAAARAVGVSYRFAWDRLRSAETHYGHALVRMERGRGAHLTEFAVHLLQAKSRASNETVPVLARIAHDFANTVAASSGRSATKLRIAASHDLALIEIKDLCAHAEPGLDIDLQFRGSLDALTELVRGRCDFAGFHVGPDAHAGDALRRLLSPRSHRLVILGERTQGLMVAAGNPKRILVIGDLARRGVRFVNRQSGSGTRILFDRLLAQARRTPADIRGYDTEEFTHVAVAATVASGHVDAGFGIQAAAARYGLSFVPLSHETYYLAARRTQLDRPAARKLLQQMRSPELARRLARMKGYRFESCGTLADIRHAFATDSSA